ncbi:hypothetical protein SS50377_26964 [Spironucleus salmonicida]|uniref:Uncharacterized protein n=1 Tax=Spironucleus salmonicida TaxID=348837 RepID=V6M2J3_9EUKA|nr:hypothetical protein SS50377_26964 [Spironucleus salmonicida]|eukprot:EST47474.1 Hypothetical protein SS50377_12460 [Spironucleus salmonicida]
MDVIVTKLTQAQSESHQVEAIKQLNVFTTAPKSFSDQPLLLALLFQFMQTSNSDLALESLYLIIKLTESDCPELHLAISDHFQVYSKFLISKEFDDVIIDLKNGIEMQELILVLLSNLMYYETSKIMINDNCKEFISRIFDTKNKKIKKFATFALSTSLIYVQFDQSQYQMLISLLKNKENEMDVEILIVIFQTIYQTGFNDDTINADFDVIFDQVEELLTEIKTIKIERCIQEAFKCILNFSMNENLLSHLGSQSFIYRMQKLFISCKSINKIDSAIFFVLTNLSCTEKGSRVMAQNSLFLTFLFSVLKQKNFVDEICDIFTNFYYYDFAGNFDNDQIFCISETIQWCFVKQKMKLVGKFVSLFRLMCGTGSKVIHVMNEMGIRSFLFEHQTIFRCKDIIEAMDKVKRM